MLMESMKIDLHAFFRETCLQLVPVVAAGTDMIAVGILEFNSGLSSANLESGPALGFGGSAVVRKYRAYRKKRDRSEKKSRTQS